MSKNWGYVKSTRCKHEQLFMLNEWLNAYYYSVYYKTCVKLPLKNRQNKDLNDKW